MRRCFTDVKLLNSAVWKLLKFQFTLTDVDGQTSSFLPPVYVSDQLKREQKV